jgi:hypothetical protein
MGEQSKPMEMETIALKMLILRTAHTNFCQHVIDIAPYGQQSTDHVKCAVPAGSAVRYH